MTSFNYVPLVELTRGPIVECIHYGAYAVVDAQNRVVQSAGDPEIVTYLRSSAKPFQVLAFVEAGGVDAFHLTERELAVMCASHHGTDEHVKVIQGIHKKIGISESDLMCGIHPPSDPLTAERMLKNGEPFTPIRHNCSGKHTGMLALCKLKGFPTEDYLDPQHPAQKLILDTFSQVTGVPREHIILGTDGCSAPVFAVPLHAAAWAFAQLADPSALPEPRQSALRRIFRAMTSNPDMIAGPSAFDTDLMLTGNGKILSKGGAEGYQALAVLPGAFGKDSPALGICLKISDGDQAEIGTKAYPMQVAHAASGRARTLASIEILRRLGALDAAQLIQLAAYAPRPLYNWRHLEIGEIRPAE